MIQFIKAHPSVPVIFISVLLGILCFVGGMEYQKRRSFVPRMMQWQDDKRGMFNQDKDRFQDRQERRQENRQSFDQQSPASPAAKIN